MPQSPYSDPRSAALIAQTYGDSRVGRKAAASVVVRRKTPGMTGGLAAVGKALNNIRKANRTFSTGVHKAAPRQGKYVADPSPTKPSNKSNSRPAVTGTDPLAAAIKARATTPVAPSGYGAKLSRVLGQAFAGLINPKAYATSAADAQYGGTISDLASQIAQAPTTEAQHHADISSWFGKAADQATAGSKRIADQGNIAADSNANATKAIMDALGGGAAAGSVGALGAIASGGLRQSAQDAGNFETQLATAIAGEGAFQQGQESNRSANSLTSLRSALTQARTQRGNAYSTALSNAQGTKFTQLGQLQNMLLGQQLAGPQFDAAALANAKSRQDLAAGDVSIATNLAQLKDFKNQTAAGPNGFGQMKPADRASLSQNLTALMVGKQGRLRTSPGRVRQQLSEYLYGTAGFKKSAHTETYLNSVANQILYGSSGVKGLSRIKEYDKGHKTAYSKQLRRR